MPDVTFKTLAEIPEGLREHAAEKDGAFVVDVAPAVKVKEFRDNNIKVVKERDEVKTKLSGYVSTIGEDPAAVAAELTQLRTIQQQVADGKLTTSDKIASEIAKRVGENEAAYKGQLTELNTKLANTSNSKKEFESKFKRSTLRQEITNVALAAESGVNPAALTDILNCAEADFAVEDNGTIVRMQNGEKVMGADGVTNQTPKEWLTGLLKSKPYFQKPSVGGGAQGGRSTGNFGMSMEDFQKLAPAERLNVMRDPKNKVAR